MADRKKSKKSIAAKTTKKQRTAKPLARSAGVPKINKRGHAKKKPKPEKSFEADSRARFRDFFKYSPVPLWEEDVSELRAYITALHSEGVTELGAHFERHPEELIKCAGLVRVVAVNNATLELYEAPDQKTMLRELSQVFTTQSFDTFRDIILALSDDTRSYECETVNRTLTGKEINILLKWNLIDSDDGDRNRVLLSTVNTTERKKAEEVLKKRERQLAESQRIAHIGSWEHNLKTGGVFWSDELFRLLGLDPGKDPGDFKIFFEMIHPDDQPVLRAAIDETLKNKTPFSVDYRFNFRDGRTGIIHAQAELIQDDEGDFVILSGTAQDITEQKRAEAALRESERRLRTLIDAIPDAVFFKDLAGCHIIANKANEELFGLSPEMLVGKTADDLLPPEIAAVCRMNDEEVLKKRQTVRCEEITKDKNGYEQVIDTIRVPLYDDDGNAMGLVGIVRDITERKLAEQRLRESEDRFRSIFEHATDGIMIGDIEQKRHVEANRAICTMLGYTRDELTNLRVEDIHPEEDVPRILDLFERQARGEVSMGFDIPMLRKDGSVLYADINSAQVALGGKKYLVGIFRDNTERKQAEEKILQSDQFIRSILDTVDEGFIVIDRDYRIVTANNAYCDQVGRTSDKVIGMPCYMISHKNSRPCFEEGEECAVKYAFETGEAHIALHKHPEGADVLYVETKAYPLKDASGTVTSVIETINNITEKHLLEEERLKTQKLESIGTLAGGIAHDFNNLLQGIFGYISMARMTSDRGKSISMLEQAEKALQQTVNLTTQLLTFSKGGQPVMKVIDLRHVIKNATAFALSGTSSDCRVAMDTDLWCAVADEGQISQVIQNIVLNASQAMPAGGRVSVSTRNVAAEDTNLPASLVKRDFIAIKIRDNGVGIPEQYLDKIFDPYFSTKEKGSGLGLATSYSIMKRHDGTITVSSSPGQGSSFTIYIPAARAETAVSERPLRTALYSDARILVMDDEEIVREVAAELLVALGHRVEFAKHGHEALSMYQEAKASGSSFDIVILDLTIRGGMGGLETLRKLREIDPDVKAVVSSGYSDDAVVAKYDDYGFKAFLQKPYDFDELRETLYSLM